MLNAANLLIFNQITIVIALVLFALSDGVKFHLLSVAPF